MKTNFEIWRDSDNVIKTAENSYKTQCSQYKKEFTHDELKAYFIREYAENSKEYADEIADLFEHYKELPEEVNQLIKIFETERGLGNYQGCKNLVSSLEKIGYTCEYGLDAEPYNLQKIETTNETPEEMNTTDKNILIAKFLGYSQPHPDFKNSSYWYKKNESPLVFLSFNTDWNWLIPAIEKCRESQIFGSQRLIDNIDKRLLKLDLLATYENVVDFIQWHNQQKN